MKSNWYRFQAVDSLAGVSRISNLTFGPITWTATHGFGCLVYFSLQLPVSCRALIWAVICVHHRLTFQMEHLPHSVLRKCDGKWSVYRKKTHQINSLLFGLIFYFAQDIFVFDIRTVFGIDMWTRQSLQRLPNCCQSISTTIFIVGRRLCIKYIIVLGSHVWHTEVNINCEFTWILFKINGNFANSSRRVLQSIALENVIPAIGILGKGRGPNKVPLYAMGKRNSQNIAILGGPNNILNPFTFCRCGGNGNNCIHHGGRHKHPCTNCNDAIFVNICMHRLLVFCIGSNIWYSNKAWRTVSHSGTESIVWESTIWCRWTW